MIRKSEIKRYIGLSFPIGACNLRCSYCYLGKQEGKVQDIPFSLEQIRAAFSKRRLGGVCFINICSDGEPLLHPLMYQIIKSFLEEGHFVSIVTNGTLRGQIEKILNLDMDLLKRFFFKISFHYEELVRMNLLDLEFSNIEMIKKSPCSLTVEGVACDETLKNIEDLKEICMKRIGALPHFTIPRDERKHSFGVISKYSWTNYVEEWKKSEIKSELFDFKEQFFGRKYQGYCYAGERMLWVNMKTGYSHQCYHTPPLQDFMGEYDKPITWFAVGNHCREAHCYVAHSYVALGVVPYPQWAIYHATYDEIRNRKCMDGSEWIKPTYKKAFRMGVEQKEHGFIKKKLVNILNVLLKWYRRRFPLCKKS